MIICIPISDMSSGIYFMIKNLTLIRLFIRDFKNFLDLCLNMPKYCHKLFSMALIQIIDHFVIPNMQKM